LAGAAAKAILETVKITVTKKIARIPKPAFQREFAGGPDTPDCALVERLFLLIVYPPGLKGFCYILICKYSDILAFVEAIF
jgi:hypothetical protein